VNYIQILNCVLQEMSCGNRFQCGITRFQKHSFTPDKPSNVELHNENQKRLSDLLKAREDIDKQFLSTTPNKKDDMSTVTLLTSQNTLQTDTTTYTPWTSDNTTNNFTPWKIPSATDFQTKPK
jgi:hypothetical protein